MSEQLIGYILGALIVIGLNGIIFLVMWLRIQRRSKKEGAIIWARIDKMLKEMEEKSGKTTQKSKG